MGDLPPAALTLGEFISQRPLRSRVCDRYGLDGCSNGALSLEEACRSANIEAGQLLRQCEELEHSQAASLRFMNFSATELAQDLLQTHHSYLAEELEALERLLERVANKHWRQCPAWPRVFIAFRELRAGLEQHLAEETGLLLDRLHGDSRLQLLSESAAGIRPAILRFEDQHEQLRVQLQELRGLLGGYCIPHQACLGQQSAVARLRELERRTLLQLYKEDNVLFNRLRFDLALAGPGRV